MVLAAGLATGLVFIQATPALAVATPGAAEAGDRMGDSVVTGDFNGDGFADLATGVPNEAIGVLGAAGAVTVVFGSVDGLVPGPVHPRHPRRSRGRGPLRVRVGRR